MALNFWWGFVVTKNYGPSGLNRCAVPPFITLAVKEWVPLKKKLSYTAETHIVGTKWQQNTPSNLEMEIVSLESNKIRTVFLESDKKMPEVKDENRCVSKR